MKNIVGMLITFVIGAMICYIMYFFSKKILKKKAKYYSMFSIVRQIINIGYLVGVYFVSSIVSVDLKYLLIGAALGITIPMFYFTNKLLKITNKTEEKHQKT